MSRFCTQGSPPHGKLLAPHERHRAARRTPQAAISYDRFHVVALAGQAMDEVRTSEWRSHPQAVTEVFGDKDSDTRRGLDVGRAQELPRAGRPNRPPPCTGCSVAPAVCARSGA